MPIEYRRTQIHSIRFGSRTATTPIEAAIAALKKQKAGHIVVAVPVAPASTIDELKTEVDEVIGVSTPEFFYAISLWYDEFPQTSGEEVRELLNKAETKKQAAAGL